MWESKREQGAGASKEEEARRSKEEEAVRATNTFELFQSSLCHLSQILSETETFQSTHILRLSSKVFTKGIHISYPLCLGLAILTIFLQSQEQEESPRCAGISYGND
jgi:hypothetical protein